MSDKKLRLVLYDGECGFCNHSVAFILKHERTNELLFASLQSNYAQNLFKEKGIQKIDLSSLYFFENNRFLVRTNAALTICKYLKPPFSWLIIFKIIPAFLRDPFYRLIAKNRKRLAGNFCVIPNQDQLKRFLN